MLSVRRPVEDRSFIVKFDGVSHSGHGLWRELDSLRFGVGWKVMTCRALFYSVVLLHMRLGPYPWFIWSQEHGEQLLLECSPAASPSRQAAGRESGAGVRSNKIQ